jgi:hypothetical protein
VSDRVASQFLIADALLILDSCYYDLALLRFFKDDGFASRAELALFEAV